MAASVMSGEGGMVWLRVCELDDILPGAGVCAWVVDRQVAVFRPGPEGEVYALDNFDPNSDANVLSRGLTGDLGGKLVVASPIYKQHFDLATGECLEKPEVRVPTHATRVEAGHVYVGVPAELARHIAPPVQRPARPRLVVVGNGMAGMRTVEELLKLAPDQYDIEVFGAEPYGNYNRILLSPLLAGEKSLAEIMLHPLDWYLQQGIALHAGDPVVSIDRKNRIVKAKSGREARYDRLLIATGSKPIMLPLPGRELQGVLTFRDVQDVESMLKSSRSHRRAIVIGGGLLGLEAANGLMRQGMDVTVVHLMDRLMERQLDAHAALLLRQNLEARGLKFVMPAQTEAILGETRVTGLRFKGGLEVPADLVVMAVGIKPNLDLAQSCGLRCERGVLVNDTLQSFDPRIYAVGECVQHRNATYGLVAPLWEQARVCATHLASVGIGRYAGSVVSTQLKVTGVDLFSAGDFLGGGDSEELVYRDPRKGVYKRLVLRNNRVLGAVLYGDVRDGGWYLELMKAATDVSRFRDRLVFGKAFCGA